MVGFLQKAFYCASPEKKGRHEYDFEDQASNECDYVKNPTQLYQLLEAKSWPQALTFLNEGRYDSRIVRKDVCRIPYEKQASIWVTRYERSGEKIRWSHIPLHAAIIFGAPYNVVKKLVEIYPDGVRCADDQAMLPLHLAFKHLTNVHTLRLVMDEFPDALFTKDNRGRLPSDIRQDERSTIIQHVISVSTSRVKQHTEERDTKEITELRKALLEQQREAKMDESTARRHRKEIQDRESAIQDLQHKIQVLQFEIKNMEKKTRYSFPFANKEGGQDFKLDPGFQLRKCIELQAENKELKEKVGALEKEIELLTTALKNQENQKNTIRIQDEDVLRFTELSDGMLHEKNKYEQEKRKNNVLAAENKRLKEEMTRISTSISTSHRMNDATVSGNSSAENRAPTTKEHFPTMKVQPSGIGSKYDGIVSGNWRAENRTSSIQERFPTMKMAPVGIGSRDLESFLESRLLKELDIENRRLEKQLAANQNMDVGALLNQQSRIQEMAREVKRFQGSSHHMIGERLVPGHKSTTNRQDDGRDDAFIDEYNRVRNRVGGLTFEHRR